MKKTYGGPVVLRHIGTRLSSCKKWRFLVRGNAYVRVLWFGLFGPRLGAINPNLNGPSEVRKINRPILQGAELMGKIIPP